VILVDTNVLVDVVSDDPLWAEWSQKQLDAAALSGALAIDPVVYAELSVRYMRMEDIETMLATADIDVRPTPREALFVAGKAFQQYRARGGTRNGVLPDFFIGAHAAVANLPLLTRDPKRYRTYFPSVQLIAPSQ
jgi:predicted nucleic acid-binding protein